MDKIQQKINRLYERLKYVGYAERMFIHAEIEKLRNQIKSKELKTPPKDKTNWYDKD